MLVMSETFINRDSETRYADSNWYESYTDDVGELFKSLREKYGRCTGHVYVDTTNGETVPVGWVFVKRVEFEDSHRYGFRGPKTYLREVWVSIGERAEEGGVYRYDVKRRKGTPPDA